MENSRTMSLPRGKCMKCREECITISCSCTNTNGDRNNHKFCQSCFRKANLSTTPTDTFYCPCCRTPFYLYMQLIDEAVLVGEAMTLSNHISPLLLSTSDVVIAEENVIAVHEINKLVIERFDAALVLSPTNFESLYSLFCSGKYGYLYVLKHRQFSLMEFYKLKIVGYSLKLLDHPDITMHDKTAVRSECCDQLARIFSAARNYSTAFKYAKVAYEICLRSADHTYLPRYKDYFTKARADLPELPPLRFAVGDEVEFLHEREWQLGKVVELYYWERSFDISFTAPYRLQLLEDSADQAPVCAWVKADIDHYVRKVGVRSIEDTRYQAKLDTKVEELAYVYYSEEFTQNIYLTLAQDREFKDMLHSAWQIKLSVDMLIIYRTLVVIRQPLVRTDSGYHIPSSDEVIAGIKAYFDPAQLSGDGDANPSPVGQEDQESNLQDIRYDIISILQGISAEIPDVIYDDNIQGLLLRSIRRLFSLLSRPNSLVSQVDMLGRNSDFTVPIEMSQGISKASTLHDLVHFLPEGDDDTTSPLIMAWIGIFICLDNPTAAPACESPFVYFFVKFCLEHNLGVPKIALALYDRMNMQLSREFIRCANPSCELNKLDRSTGKIKFRQCSRCLAVIYCGKACQTAHYPEHKMLCIEHSTG